MMGFYIPMANILQGMAAQHMAQKTHLYKNSPLPMNSGAELNCDSVNLFDKLGNIYILLYALSIRLYFVVPPRIFFVGRGRLVG